MILHPDALIRSLLPVPWNCLEQISHSMQCFWNLWGCLNVSMAHVLPLLETFPVLLTKFYGHQGFVWYVWCMPVCQNLIKHPLTPIPTEA
jgi:hypothetical protein